VSERTVKNWEREIKEPILSSTLQKLRTAPPLKDRLSNAIYSLKTLSNKLNEKISELEQREKEFFNKCVDAQMARDSSRANVYASECTQLRKMIKILLNGQMAVEQVVVRLETLQDFGDIATQIAPLVPLVHSIKTHLTGVMPEASRQLENIGETLNNLVIEAGEANGIIRYDASISGEEAENVLREACAVAEQRLKEKFPDLPTVPQAELKEVSH
jgi:division protein CdvB (Snf7/Vps24/ESCRT-III family)